MSDAEDFFLDVDDPIDTVQLAKRRRSDGRAGSRSKKQKVTSDSEDELDKNVSFAGYSSSGDEGKGAPDASESEEEETAAEKRLRMAQNYLKALSNQESFTKLDDAKAGMSTKLQEEAVCTHIILSM